jgi:hypothetical protein
MAMHLSGLFLFVMDREPDERKMEGDGAGGFRLEGPHTMFNAPTDTTQQHEAPTNAWSGSETGRVAKSEARLNPKYEMESTLHFKYF